MIAAVLAVDAGNSKTDVALLGHDGTLLGYARGPGSNHQANGVDAAIEVLSDCVWDAVQEAGISSTPIAQRGAFYLAGADYPSERQMLRERVSDQGWIHDLDLDNDGFALMRAGTQASNRIGVVCGAGMNCVGESAGRSRFQFPAVGRISGDWGGGGDLGMEALFHALRAEDGRGEETLLQQAVREHFGVVSVADVTEGFHFGRLPLARIHELSPVLLRVADAGDQVASRVVLRLAQEVFYMVRVAMDRLGLRGEPTDVVLGGGVLAARQPQLMDEVFQQINGYSPLAAVKVSDHPPIVGAALLGLDALGATTAAEAKIRSDLMVKITGEASQPRATPARA